MSIASAPAIVLVVSAALFFVAMLRGAAPERLLSGALLVSALVEATSLAVWPMSGARTQPLICLVSDVLLLGAIVAVALHANRQYPLWLGGVQIATLACHFGSAALRLSPRAHAAMQLVPVTAELFVMMVGLAFHIAVRRRRVAPSWTG
jgi:hypothetical protein